MRERKLSTAEIAALIALHRGGIEGMRIPGVVMVSCATVRSLFKRGVFAPEGGVSARWAEIARELSDAEHYGSMSAI